MSRPVLAKRLPRCAARCGLRVLLLSLFTSAVSAQSELHQVHGLFPDQRLGLAVSAVGDLNGDGYADFAASSLEDPAGVAGPLRVYSGVDGSVIRSFAVPTPGAAIFSMGYGGDVNADGVSDVCLGMPGAQLPPGPQTGRVVVYSGLDDSELYAFEGGIGGDFFGSRVAIDADVNNDGYSDILIRLGAGPAGNPDPATCRVYSGVDGSILLSFAEPSIPGFATDIDYAGDTNGDGVEDIVIGSVRETDETFFPVGSARIYSGVDGTLLHTAFGDALIDRFGTQVRGVGDVNRDGFADVLVGANRFNFPEIERGYAKVISGVDGSVLYHFASPDPLQRLIGNKVAGPGDVNQDGYADLLIQTSEGYTQIDDPTFGTYFTYTRTGARLYSGRDGTLLQAFGNDASWTDSTVELAAAGDVNGDGTPDVLMAHPLGNLNSSEAGALRVYAGRADEFVESCNGDGGNQASCTDCPCRNNAPAGTVGGCLNSAGRSARLHTFGSPSLSYDQLRMELTGGLSNAFALLVSSENLAPASATHPCFGQASGVTFAGSDGLRCTATNMQRHGARATDSNGAVGRTTAGWGPPNGPASGLIAQGGFTAGQTRHFQVLCREDRTLGCLTGLNSSQGISVSFLP